MSAPAPITTEEDSPLTQQPSDATSDDNIVETSSSIDTPEDTTLLSVDETGPIGDVEQESSEADTPSDEKSSGSDESTEEDKSCAEMLVNEDDSINWDIPCFKGFRDSPCWNEFKKSYSCFYYSKEEQRGSDCVDAFRTFALCTKNNPQYFPPDEEEEQKEKQEEQEDPLDDPSDTTLEEHHKTELNVEEHEEVKEKSVDD